MPQKSLLTLCIAFLLASSSALAGGNLPSREEMWQTIKKQQQQIEQLQAWIEETAAKSEAAVEAAEEQASRERSSSWADRTTLGGYAEAHYNNLQGSGGANDKNQIDLHRVVLFLGHEFNDRIRFFSEIEFEHDGEEVEVEQAYVEMDFSRYISGKAGVFLLPVGILNETHEPNTFYGVERNPVEKNIIPSTWWATGIAASGEIAQAFSYDLGFHEGLKTSADNSYLPRKGRQKAAEALAENGAFTARLRWAGMAGLELAGTFQHQIDITQGRDSSAGSANLYEAHVAYEKGPFGLRALYARWNLAGSGPAAIGADEQYGWYVEPSFKITDSLGLFARYNQWDNQAGSNSDSQKAQWNIGFNWWPHEQVVLKADYQVQDNENGEEQDGFNLGVGLQF